MKIFNESKLIMKSERNSKELIFSIIVTTTSAA